jgi:hypothetical protein
VSTKSEEAECVCVHESGKRPTIYLGKTNEDEAKRRIDQKRES